MGIQVQERPPSPPLQLPHMLVTRPTHSEWPVLTAWPVSRENHLWIQWVICLKNLLVLLKSRNVTHAHCTIATWFRCIDSKKYMYNIKGPPSAPQSQPPRVNYRVTFRRSFQILCTHTCIACLYKPWKKHFMILGRSSRPESSPSLQINTLVFLKKYINGSSLWFSRLWIISMFFFVFFCEAFIIE